MTFSALDGDHMALASPRATMRLIFEMARGRGGQDVAAHRASTAPHEACGYFRTYTPEGGGPFGRKITEPYTEWVRSHARGARTSGGAAP